AGQEPGRMAARTGRRRTERFSALAEPGDRGFETVGGARVNESALSGVTVLELGQAFMGPYCALLMQRLGADVITVEPPQGEPYRRRTPRKGVEAIQFGLLNVGKRSLCVDLKQPAGRELFAALAKTVDVIVQNYAPGAFDRLVGIDQLMAANPRLIVASGSGY